jgi:hypothetical protein
VAPLQHKLYQQVFAYDTNSSVQRTAVTISLEKHEFAERVAFLNLAVWKAACVRASLPTGTFCSVLDCQDWTRSGWKILKTEMRESNIIAIVFAHAVPWP